MTDKSFPKKIVLKSVFFVGIFFLIICVLCEIFVPKWIYMEDPEDWDGQTSQFNDFYHLEENTIDVIILGSSMAMYSFYPIELFEKEGIISYSLASPHQQMAASYYWLQEACKTQTPMYVVLDVTKLVRNNTDERNGLETFTWKSLANMKWSLTKLEAVLACKADSSSLLEYIFPLIRFHDRWDRLEKKDFSPTVEEYPNYVKGAQISTVISPYWGFKQYHTPERVYESTEYRTTFGESKKKFDFSYSAQIDSVSEQYLKKIREFCSEHGITLLCVKAPCISTWTEEFSDCLANYSKENGIEIIDLMYGENQIDINWDMDTLDHGAHLNYFGAVKASEYLAQKLSAAGAPDRRENKKYAVWARDLEDYKYYINMELNKLKSDEEKALLYLHTLAEIKQNSVIIISAQDDISNGWNNSFDSAFKMLGLSTNLYNKIQQSFITVIDEGNVRFEKIAEEPIVYRDAFIDYEDTVHCLEILSAGMPYGNTCSVCIDGLEYANLTKGLNIVVFDKEKQQVISSVAIDIYLNGKMLINDKLE